MRGVGIVGRVALGILALLGLLVMAAGAAVAGVVGSDDTVFNRPTDLGDDGRPVLTSPDLLAYEGITVTLRASAPGGVFIGTAHPVDVADFVGDSSRIRLTRVTRSGVVAEDAGSAEPVRPASAGFWTSSMRGEGVEELTLDRDSAASQWVIAPLTGKGPTTVSFGVTVPGLFRAALLAFGLGALALLACVELLLRWRRTPRAPERPAIEAPPEVDGPVVDRPLVDRPVVDRPVVERPAGRHRAQRTAVAMAVVLSATGCTWEDLMPAKRQPTDLAATKVALTKAELPALLASYDRRLGQAIEAAQPPRYGADLWRLADRGPALESDLFGTRVARLTAVGGRSSVPHDPVGVYAPRFASYPMWSLVASTTGDDKRIDLFTKASVQAPWLRQAGTTVSRGLPEAGRPARAASSEQAAAATARWRTYLRSGTTDDGLVLDPDSEEWRENVADLGSRAMFRSYTVSVEAAGKSGLSRVVEVDDGALAIVALRMTTRLAGRPDLRVRWAPPYGEYRPSADGVLSFAHLAVGVIHLPSKGPARVLGATYSEVAVTP
ncbi:hypothetical protein [Nocardioides sp.]|uniref:hypothetical protein n=1 Tax=Nocardioides sp. TaxID=35761 RepID=UPI002CEDA832|nr:hypothetical protein [Nocardioides sp.]HXH79722.1 hypothetical protein [Nocardioides sp.]